MKPERTVIVTKTISENGEHISTGYAFEPTFNLNDVLHVNAPREMLPSARWWEWPIAGVLWWTAGRMMRSVIEADLAIVTTVLVCLCIPYAIAGITPFAVQRKIDRVASRLYRAIAGWWS